MKEAHFDRIEISDFRLDTPPFLKSQNESLDWLAKAYALANSESAQGSSHAESSPYAQGSPNRQSAKNTENRRTETSYRRLLAKVAANDTQISTRAHYATEFSSAPVSESDLVLSLATLSQRNRFYETAVFERLPKVLNQKEDYSDLFHVTCTGYVSPSPIQRWVANKNESAVRSTNCLHLYHMGCYAAIPALRQAVQIVQSEKSRKIGVVHSELCTLHIDPRDPTAEEMVIQSLFADGICGYSVRARVEEGKLGNAAIRSFEPLSFYEEIIPGTESAMTWEPGDTAFQMTLSKDVPNLVAQHLREILIRGYGTDSFEKWCSDSSVVWAVHPGGPKILDLVERAFELSPNQMAHSRAVLRARGNMSSATLPHIWNAILNDEGVPDQSQVITMAFGPGLTVTTAHLKKRSSPA